MASLHTYYRVELRIIGFGSIVIELDAICSCDCENQQVSSRRMLGMVDEQE